MTPLVLASLARGPGCLGIDRAPDEIYKCGPKKRGAIGHLADGGNDAMQPSGDHSNRAAHVPASGQPPGVWHEVELLLVVLLVLGVYFSRLTDLTIRGEEPRWARVAQEMLDTGDYVVPRQQGQPFADRPPLNSWAMIVASKFTGKLDLAAIRLPAVLATLFTAVLIYVYGRNYLSPAGAMAAAKAYATLGPVLRLGRVAESDALMTLFLSSALFSWHYAYDRRRNPRLAWLCGYALAALAALAKGPQGPVYFVAITGVYLLLRRDWRFLLGRWHLAGVGLLIAIVAIWQVPFMLSLDPSTAWRVWAEEGNLATRFQVTDLPRAFEHWTSFPFEVFGAMLPWSLMLPVLATRWFRQNLDEARPMFIFAATALAVTFPTCWLPVESRPRYLMSLYPCVALLVGVVVQRSCEAPQIDWWRRSWDNFLLTGVGLILVAPVALIALWAFGGARLNGVGEANHAAFLAAYSVTALAAVAVALWSRRGQDPWRLRGGLLAVTGFLGLTYTGAVVNMQIHTCNNPRSAVASIREMIPQEDHLVSFGHVHHLFAFYYEQPIEFHALDDHVAPSDTPATYFCFSDDPGFETPTIPFAWERVAEISCDRAKTDRPRARVIIGRRVSLVADAQPDRQRTAGNPLVR
jgi:4-amino-4-deoxy-L-arabinose transferase-like glycosyltransferase